MICADRTDHIHAGTDIYRPLGTQVQAIIPGTVIFAGDSYGAYQGAVITHGTFEGEDLWVVYGHLAVDSAFPSEGSLVSIEQTIGKLGVHHAGSHLHLEILTDVSEIRVVNFLTADKQTKAYYENGLNKIGLKQPRPVPTCTTKSATDYYLLSTRGKVNQAHNLALIMIDPVNWKPALEGKVAYPFTTPET